MDLDSLINSITSHVEGLNIEEKISALNKIRQALHEVSPFKSEPVDCVIWVKNDTVHANDYNPNSVAPPEMLLLEHSIKMDGYTQPIVTAKDEDIGKDGHCKDSREVIDGFHRNRVAKESPEIQNRLFGYLPVVTINESRIDVGDRMASTVRHNRARGKHNVEKMSDMVIHLKRRNWNDEKIGKELGMEPDEVTRLCQVTGLAEAFADKDFSCAWEAIFMEEE